MSNFIANDSCGNPSALLQLANRASVSGFRSQSQNVLSSYQNSVQRQNAGTFHMKKLLSSLEKPTHVQWSHEVTQEKSSSIHSTNSSNNNLLVNDFFNSYSKRPSFTNSNEGLLWNPNQSHHHSMSIMPGPVLSFPTSFYPQQTQNEISNHHSLDVSHNPEAIAAQKLIENVKDVELEQTDFMNYMRHIAQNKESSSALFDESESYEPANRMAMWDGYSNWAKLIGLNESELDFLKMYTSEDETASATNQSSTSVSANNPLLHAEDPFALGQSLMRQGLLSDAIVAYEAAVQQNANHAKAWCELAVTYAENDQDDSALFAAERALQLSPSECSSVLLSIARIHTNEQRGGAALLALKEWLRSQSRYEHLVKDESPLDINSILHVERYTSFVSPDELTKMENLLLEATRLSLIPIDDLSCPRDSIDPQLQTGMGIFYHLRTEFQKAADCFETALQIEPSNALLWNKLGATLANNEQDENAIHAYRRAIELAPGYVRARANLSLSCLALNANREALEHACAALQLQTRSRYAVNVTSDDYSASLWKCAAVAARRIGDADLLRMTYARNLNGLLTSMNISVADNN